MVAGKMIYVAAHQRMVNIVNDVIRYRYVGAFQGGRNRSVVDSEWHLLGTCGQIVYRKSIPAIDRRRSFGVIPLWIRAPLRSEGSRTGRSR